MVQDDSGEPSCPNFKERVSRMLSNANIVEDACYALRTAVCENPGFEDPSLEDSTLKLRPPKRLPGLA